MNFVLSAESEDGGDDGEEKLHSSFHRRMVEAQIRDNQSNDPNNEGLVMKDFEEVVVNSISSNAEMISEVEQSVLETQQWRERRHLDYNLEQILKDLDINEDSRGKGTGGRDDDEDEEEEEEEEEAPESESADAPEQSSPRTDTGSYDRIQTLLKTLRLKNNKTNNDDNNNNNHNNNNDSNEFRDQDNNISDKILVSQLRMPKANQIYNLPTAESMLMNLAEEQVHDIERLVRDENFTQAYMKEQSFLESEMDTQNGMLELAANLRGFTDDLDDLLSIQPKSSKYDSQPKT